MRSLGQRQSPTHRCLEQVIAAGGNLLDEARPYKSHHKHNHSALFRAAKSAVKTHDETILFILFCLIYIAENID
jgi:hypothetical protein